MSEEEIITSPREDLEWQIRLQSDEIERLNNIIKEIREEIKEIFEDENWYSNYSYNDLEIKLKDVLEILDKENK